MDVGMSPSHRVRLSPILFHQVLLQVKVEADSKPNCICKTQFSCPTRPNGGIRTVIRYAQTNSYSKVETFSTIWNSST